MNKLISKQLAAIAVGFLAIVLIVVVALIVANQSRPSTTTTQSTTPAATPPTQSADVITYTATTNGSALDQLKAINDTVIVKQTDMGSYVDSINGLAGGTDGKYWSFYVDGEMAQVGAGEFMPKGGEKIVWKFQKL